MRPLRARYATRPSPPAAFPGNLTAVGGAPEGKHPHRHSPARRSEAPAATTLRGYADGLGSDASYPTVLDREFTSVTADRPVARAAAHHQGPNA
ncbi:hypothetical protein AQJ64_01860 [Streptomyces griseoruber]|uniref:Uncharacterized protein n=1 Tax=Streptomyces griseoruber TaxID=1943 RepID=A0A101TAB2_9ACTN|nr:hypothetical protein AQJ64_01860 [Streptomyces griseoruber]